MKITTKKIYYLTILISAIFNTTGLLADITDALNCFKPTFALPPIKVDATKAKTYQWVEKGKEAAANTTSVGFSIYNKSGQDLFMTVDNSTIGKRGIMDRIFDRLIGRTIIHKLPKGKIFDIELNILNPTTLTIYNCKDFDSCDPSNKKNIAYQYQFPKGKTIYVTWQPQAPKQDPNNPSISYKLYPRS